MTFETARNAKSIAKNIAIIGCGPAGLSAAIFLRRRGHRITLYEQFKVPTSVGSGLMLQPTGMSVLHELGLLDEVVSRSQRIERILGRDYSSGKTVLDMSYEKLGGERFGLGIHRHVLFQVLFDAAKVEGISFEFATPVTKIDIASSSLSPVNANGTKLAKFDAVIVASGSGSLIANEIFGLKNHDFLPFGALWATVDWPRSGFNKNMLEQRYDGTGIMVGVLPLGNVSGQSLPGDDKAALFWSLKGSDLAATKSAGIERWRENLTRYWPQAYVLTQQIDGFDALTFARYRHYTLKKPFHGPVVFIGDSYHSASPQLGQGANMALLDAMALDMAFKMCGGDVGNVGQLFYSLRARHIAIYQLLSKIFTPFYQSDSRLLGFVRDKLVSAIVQIPPAPRLMAAMVAGLFAEPFRQKIRGVEGNFKFCEPDWREVMKID